ncbi:MAG: DegT/DnrJ/EryC1/StrS family aminotransferase [Eubacteriales bacterium]|nr:DegT/DnrJ/EryC1/StrS family aminotransferase [Eubacteriales bacterium]
MDYRDIPFSPPDISQAEIDEVVDTLRSGWITTGPKVKRFEREIADYCGTKRAICLNSATAALEMALRVLGVGPGDEVIVPAYTYTASVSVIDHVGATIVMVDTARDGYEADYDALAAAVTPRTKAVIPVDLAGTPCDYDRLFEIVTEKRTMFQPANDLQRAIGRVAIITDGAHAFGATWRGRRVGAIADMTAFSFHAVKNLTTAEGGALTWHLPEGVDDEVVYTTVNRLSLHGQTKDALAKTGKGSWEYDILEPAFKCNMTDIMGAIGLAQLKRYNRLLARRRVLAAAYDAGVKTLGLKTRPFQTDVYESSRHLYMIRIPGADEEKRNAVIREMAERGIACNVHYKPLPMLTAYKNLGFDINDFPNAHAQYKNGMTLPFHTLLSDEDVQYVLACLKESLDAVL